MTHPDLRAAGTVVPMLDEDQCSITAGRPDAPYVALVAACLLAVVGTIGWAARAVRNA